MINPNFTSYQWITFNQFYDLTTKKADELSCSEKKFLTSLEFPGIYAIHYFPKKRTYFTCSYSNCLDDMSVDFYDLFYARFQDCDLLFSDYWNQNTSYDWNDFAFFIFCVGPEWDSENKIKNELEKIKKTWPGECYN